MLLEETLRNGYNIISNYIVFGLPIVNLIWFDILAIEFAMQGHYT